MSDNTSSELVGCVKVEVKVLVPNIPYGHCGRKVTRKKKKKTNNTQKAGLAQR